MTKSRQRIMRVALRQGSLYILLAALLVGTLWRGAYFPTPDKDFHWVGPAPLFFDSSLFTPRWLFVTLLLLAGAWELAALAVERRADVLRSPLLWLFAAFTAFSGATYLWSTEPAVTLKDSLLLLALASVLLVVRGQQLRFPGEAMSRISWWMVYTAAFVSVWGIVTYMLRIAPYANEVDGIYRAGGTLEYSNALGCFALMALPFAPALMARAKKDDRLLLAAGITVLTAAVVLSFSRSALMLLVLVSIYLLVESRGGIRFVLVITSLGAGAILAAVSLLTAEARQPVAGTILMATVLLLSYLAQGYLMGTGLRRALRIAGIFAGGLVVVSAFLAAVSARPRNIIYERFGEGFAWSRLLPHREATWSGALDAVRERPVKGWGLGSFPQVYQEFSFTSYTKYAHNLVLQAAVESGIIGAALMALFLLYVVLLVLLRLVRRTHPLVRAAAIAVLVFVAFNIFDWEWYVPALAAWFMAAAALVESDTAVDTVEEAVS